MQSNVVVSLSYGERKEADVLSNSKSSLHGNVRDGHALGSEMEREESKTLRHKQTRQTNVAQGAKEPDRDNPGVPRAKYLCRPRGNIKSSRMVQQMNHDRAGDGSGCAREAIILDGGWASSIPRHWLSSRPPRCSARACSVCLSLFTRTWGDSWIPQMPTKAGLKQDAWMPEFIGTMGKGKASVSARFRFFFFTKLTIRLTHSPCYNAKRRQSSASPDNFQQTRATVSLIFSPSYDDFRELLR